MISFWGEFLGTALLVLFGNGAIANHLLYKTKGHNSGWITVTAGWAIALMMGIYAANWISGAHLNPAVTLAFCFLQKISFRLLPLYIAGQLSGAFVGALLVGLIYFPHLQKTGDGQTKLSCFATIPSLRSYGWNFFSEMMATAVFVLSILILLNEHSQISYSLFPVIMGLLLFGIGVSLGGPTGFALNPARDLAPRLAYGLLPIKGKGSCDWSYAVIPAIAPLCGGVLGALLYQLYIYQIIQLLVQ